MKIRIEDTPVAADGVNGGYFHIRLYPETVAEVAQLERPLVVEIQPEKFQRNVCGDELHYVIAFQSYARRK